MKVSLNIKFINGPYGGGLQFAKSLKNFLIKKNIDVVNNLQHDDIDIILIVAHSKFSTASYSFTEARIYKIRHNKTIIINRINNSDQGRGTENLNDVFLKISKFSNHNIFISKWVKNIFPQISEKKCSIIRNGGDQEIFNTNDKKFWDKNNPIKIVTHHWSVSPNKGHELYLKLDGLIGKSENKLEFSYIGNFPLELKEKFKHTNFIAPKSDLDLAGELKKHDVYITAAKNEAGGMHHIEGALCGLPILYINSGALPEYCSPYGLMISSDNLGEKINQIKKDYKSYLEKLKEYEFTSENMNKKYLDLFLKLYENYSTYNFNQGNIFIREAWITFLKITDIYYSIRYIFFVLLGYRKKLG